MKLDDIRAATDEELLRFSRPTSWELLAPRLFAPLSGVVILALLVFVGVVTFTDGSEGLGPMLVGILILFVTVGLGVFAVLGGTLFLLGRPERRSKVHRAELTRRYGQGGFDEELRHAREVEDRDQAPEYTILFSAQEMPGGRHYWTRLDLMNGADGELSQALLELRVGPLIDLQHDADPLARIVRRQVALTLAPDMSLVRFLRGLDLEKLRSVKSCIINGMPCEIAVLRRGSDKVYRGGCNFVEQDDRVETAPVMRLVGILLKTVRDQM